MSTSTNTTGQDKSPYPYVAIGGGVLLLLLGLIVGFLGTNWAIAELPSKVSMSANADPKQQGKPEPAPVLANEPKASKTAEDFMTLLVKGDPEKAYQDLTSEFFQTRRTRNEFRKKIAEYPPFNGFGRVHYDPQATKGKNGEVIFEGEVRSKVGSSKFRLEITKTDQGWKVSEFIVKD